LPIGKTENRRATKTASNSIKREILGEILQGSLEGLAHCETIVNPVEGEYPQSGNCQKEQGLDQKEKANSISQGTGGG